MAGDFSTQLQKVQGHSPVVLSMIYCSEDGLHASTAVAADTDAVTDAVVTVTAAEAGMTATAAAATAVVIITDAGVTAPTVTAQFTAATATFVAAAVLTACCHRAAQLTECIATTAGTSAKLRQMTRTQQTPKLPHSLTQTNTDTRPLSHTHT